MPRLTYIKGQHVCQYNIYRKKITLYIQIKLNNRSYRPSERREEYVHVKKQRFNLRDLYRVFL